MRTDVIRESGTANFSAATVFTPGFSVVFVIRSLVVCVMLCINPLNISLETECPMYKDTDDN
jgi:Na+-transporting methylmalonyl-CoA/oxaloacetate decarboxylase gamma subunit